MSATGRNIEGCERLADDAYETPSWCVHRLLDSIGRILPFGDHRWLEPGAGSGNIIRAVNSYCTATDLRGPRWTAVEKNRRYRIKLKRAVGREEIVIGDYLDYKPRPNQGLFSVTIMNPPFSLAQQFIKRSMCFSDVVIALVRLNYLASERRAEFMRAHTPSVYVLPNHPSFTGGRTDATECAWLAWGLRVGPWIQILGVTSKIDRHPSGDK